VLTRLDKCPWPYAGGKADAAPAVWAALGDAAHYAEPFAGSLAVLLRRPHTANRTYFSETVNDVDGLLVNAWRSMQLSPDAMAEAASWPVSEADLHARHLALVRWREEHQLEHLMGDPAWHDPVMGGWWAWGQSCWIGAGWGSGRGPWVVGDDGRIRRRSEDEPGVKRPLPRLGNNGQGVNRPQAREPGVKRVKPFLTSNGQGVNHPGTREPGVKRPRPSIVNNGQGVTHPGTREPGVKRPRPSIANNGLGVNRPQAREPGVGEYHPMLMPELLRWFRFLAARLRHVRILNGDWTRAVTVGALKMLNVRYGGGHAGVFLDPPYSAAATRESNTYACDSETVADDVREWCIANGDEPAYRIVLAGFEGEHNVLEEHGWRVVEWFRSGFLKGGMGNLGSGGQQARERLWLSPGCLAAPRQMDLI